MPDLSKNLKDAGYVAIGFGVIGFQRAQVLRHDATKRLSARLADASATVEKGRETVAAGLGQLGQIDLRDRIQNLDVDVTIDLTDLGQRLEQLDERIDPVIDQLTDRLPEAAREAVELVRTRAKDARSQLVSRVTSA